MCPNRSRSIPEGADTPRRLGELIPCILPEKLPPTRGEAP